ncbi:MAG: hypothetical protein WDW38_007211 [Sanguina aurantia]
MLAILRTLDLVTVSHTLCLGWWLRVWLWHTSEAALVLPGSRGFGWFFRYLTFYSFTLQLAQLCLCTVYGWSRKWRGGRPSSSLTRLAGWSDDLSCAALGFATATTILYHIVDAALGRKGIVEGEAERPVWLSPSVHVFNFALAWADTAFASPRTFTRRAEILSTCLVTVYICIILGSRHVNGKFPYPFLNQLPLPQGFILMLVLGIAIFYGFFQIGRQVNKGRTRLEKYLAHAGPASGTVEGHRLKKQ